MSLPARIEKFAARHDCWRTDTRIVAAVSGGSDSVAMLLLLHDLHSRQALHLDAVAHVNHRIRREADEDEAFCRELAERLGLPFVSARIDVPSQARAARHSLELASRIARRHFLDFVRRDRGADVIATAHTEDDQAETVLLRLLRGAGSRGLAGIAPRQGRRIRPVLCATKSELRDELVSRGQSWREDSSNTDLRHRRNRVRHELLPYLSGHFNPAIQRTLARTADVLRREDAFLARTAAAAAVALLQRQGDRVTFEAAGLRRLPDAVSQRVLIDAALDAFGRTPSQEDLKQIANVAEGNDRAADLSCGRVEHFAGKVVLVPSRTPRAPSPVSCELAVPGQVRFAGWILEAERFDLPQGRLVQPDVAQIDAAAVQGELSVRNRRPGDRLRPLGLGGSKKVQDVLVDRKVDRRERDAVPIVTDSTGRIVWVAGHVLGEAFRVTEGTKGVIILKLRRV